MRDDDDQHAQPADGELREAGPRLLGDTLATARSAHALSIQQLAAELRVEPALLLALEGERFSELGPAVFVKGYLKQYAHRLGLDYADLLRRYQQAADVEEMPIVHRSGTRWQDGRRGTRALAVLAVIAVTATGSWMLWSSGVVEDLFSRNANGDESGTPDVASTSSGASVSTLASSPASAPAGVQPARPSVEAEQRSPASIVPAGAAPDAQEVPNLADDRGSAASDDAAGETGVAELSAAEVADAGSGQGQTLPTAAGPGVPVGGASQPAAAGQDGTVPESHTGIVLSVNDDCWVEISDADGGRVYYGLARAGQTLTLSGQAPLSFVLGNAASVALEIDGQPYPLPTDDVIGNIARFTVAGRDGLNRQ